VVPIEDWISTVSFLIGRCCSKESTEKVERLHLVIHIICMACTSPSHVRSLVNEGILGYWEAIHQTLLETTSHSEGEGGVDVRVAEAISHLTSIDKELSSKIDMKVLLDFDRKEAK
jgi:hypothetical protein